MKEDHAHHQFQYCYSHVCILFYCLDLCFCFSLYHFTPRSYFERHYSKLDY